MKKVVVVLVVLLSLALAQVGQAADLQADWYVNIYTVYVFGYDTQGQSLLLGNAYFYSNPTGQYDPFYVGGPEARRYEERDISVPNTVYGATSEQSLVLPLTLGLSSDYSIHHLYISADTKYDPSQMYLELWHIRSSGTAERIWTQQTGGTQFISATTAFDNTVEGGYYFRVAIVPEPAGIVSLLAITPLIFAFRRRQL